MIFYRIGRCSARIGLCLCALLLVGLGFAVLAVANAGSFCAAASKGGGR